VTRYSKGAVPLRDALGLPPSRAIDGWTLRMYEAALERLLEREQASGRRSEAESEGG
jgi:hypothetical protein